jgi:raffinose/stachyose/melibiose transport system substrate-binding protein
MKLSRITIISLVGILMLLSVGMASAQDKTVVTVWWGDGDENQCQVDTVVDAFNAQSDNTVLEAVLQADQWDVTRTAVSGGGGPDVVVTPGPSFVFELANAGLILPMDNYADLNNWDDAFVDWALSLGLVDGELYSLSTELETMILYYNKTLFEEYSWELPDTMDDLMELAAEIEAEGIIPFSHGNAEWRPANEWFVSAFLNSVAGPDNVYAALTGDLAWTDESFVGAIEDLDTMQQNGWFSGGLDIYYTITFDEFLTAFGNGEAAMNMEGSWRMSGINDFFGEAADNENDWDWIPVPSTTGEDIFSLGTGSTYSINAWSENPDNAAEVLTYIFSPETQAAITVACGLAPAPVRISADMLDGIDERQARLFEAIGEASDAGNYGYLTWTFWPPKSDVYIYEEIELLWDGQTTAEDYLAGLDEVFQEELEAGDIPPIPLR